MHSGRAERRYWRFLRGTKQSQFFFTLEGGMKIMLIPGYLLLMRRLMCIDEIPIEIPTVFDKSLLAVEIHVNYTKPFRIALRPLKIVK